MTGEGRSLNCPFVLCVDVYLFGYGKTGVVGGVRVFSPTLYYPANIYNPDMSPRLAEVTSTIFTLRGGNFSVGQCGLTGRPTIFTSGGRMGGMLRRGKPSTLPIALLGKTIIGRNGCPSGSRLTR